MKYASYCRASNDALDEACAQLVGHTNWEYVDEIIPSDTVQCGVGDNVMHLIAIYKEPLEKEEEK